MQRANRVRRLLNPSRSLVTLDFLRYGMVHCEEARPGHIKHLTSAQGQHSWATQVFHRSGLRLSVSSTRGERGGVFQAGHRPENEHRRQIRECQRRVVPEARWQGHTYLQHVIHVDSTENVCSGKDSIHDGSAAQRFEEPERRHNDHPEYVSFDECSLTPATVAMEMFGGLEKEGRELISDVAKHATRVETGRVSFKIKASSMSALFRPYWWLHRW